MVDLHVKTMTLENFQAYGSFAPLTPPAMLAQLQGGFSADGGGVLTLGPQGSNQVAIGICQTPWRPLVIDTCEYHSYCGEGILPLDGDIILHLAPAGEGTTPPRAAIEVFYVPQGTMVCLKPGVWHHAPFPVQEGAVVNTVILLPQRTYANDCVCQPLEPVLPFAI